MRLTAFGGAFQPGLYRPPSRNFANPAPLGLSAFALTTFVLSLINVNTRNIGHPNLVVALAYGYGGLVQLLAGMWYAMIYPLDWVELANNHQREMAVGNTFGATALSSYGGFWLSFAIILTPGGFEIESSLQKFGESVFLNSFGLYLMGWFIFTFLLLLCTLRSTVAFFSLFFTLDLAFLMLGIGYLQHDGAKPQGDCIIAGGAFGLMAAFLAWYNALAGIADSSNRLVLHLLHTARILIAITVSSSSPSRISPGPRRVARGATRSTTRPHANTLPRQYALLVSRYVFVERPVASTGTENRRFTPDQCL